MMAQFRGADHLDQSDLLRLLDEDGSADEMRGWRRHVQACTSCASELDVLTNRASRLSDLLSSIQLPADFSYPAPPARIAGDIQLRPARRSVLQGTWARAAAIALLLVIPLAMVPPLRAALAEWISSGWTGIAAAFDAEPAPGTHAARAPDAATSATLWFTPAGDEMRIAIDSLQAGGMLVLRRTESSQGSIQVSGADGSETPLISEREMRIINSRSSRATYEVGVPGGVHRVSIQIGGGPAIEASGSDIDGGKALELVGPTE